MNKIIYLLINLPIVAIINYFFMRYGRYKLTNEMIFKNKYGRAIYILDTLILAIILTLREFYNLNFWVGISLALILIVLVEDYLVKKVFEIENK